MDNGTVMLVAAQVLVLFFGIGLHEYAHCKFADMAGDPTPRYYGRVTLNLFKHFEPIGTLMMVLSSIAGFGLGWGRPAPLNPSKMRNPRWDQFIAVLAGPVSNVVQAVFWAFVLRLGLQLGWFQGMAMGSTNAFFALLCYFGVAINLGLAIFNLIPFGPLDGHWLVGLLLPEKQRFYWFKFNQQVGVLGLFFALILLQRSGVSLTAGPVDYFFRLLTGVGFGAR